jgi:hypothetical protein
MRWLLSFRWIFVGAAAISGAGATDSVGGFSNSLSMVTTPFLIQRESRPLRFFREFCRLLSAVFVAGENAIEAH